MAKADGDHDVAKKQKNVLLDEGVCELVDVLQRLSGATFPRIVTAALLDYMFDGLDDADPHPDIGPDPKWMRIAVEIERGERTVDTIPGDMLDGALQMASRIVGSYDHANASASDLANLKKWRAIHRVINKRRIQWNNGVQDFGGDRAAIEELLASRFSTPSTSK